MASEHDHVGSRGEAIFIMLVTRRHPSCGVLFDLPRHLGEKKSTVDFFVELVGGETTTTPFLLVQVKTTRIGYTVREQRLRVRVSDKEMRKLAAYPAPAYVVGIDELGERGYIVCAKSSRATGFTSMCTDYPLTPDGLEMLWEDVARFWSLDDRTSFSSTLLDPRWRLS